MAFGSLLHPCIEGCGMDRFMKLNDRIETLDPFSEERDAFATTIFGESVQLSFDGEGRIMLPDVLIEMAGLSDQAVFVGKGEIFEIWEPEAFSEHKARARALAISKRHQLRGNKGGDA